MKIILLGPFPVGNKGLNGQSIANKTLLDGLQESHDVDFINTARNLEFTDKKDQGKFKIGKFLRILVGFIREIAKILFGKYDVIYMTPGQSFLGFMRFSPYMLVSFIKKIPCYIHIHGSKFRDMYDKQTKIKKSMIRFLLKKLSGVIILGDSLRFMFEDLVEKDKIYVCKNAVQNGIIASNQEIENKIKNMTNNKKVKILYLSNLMKEKGILELLKASESFSEEESEFNLAGAIEPEIQCVVRTYLEKYPKKIFYHGIVSGEKKKKLFLENSIFILPSWDEGQPISILEAYVNGCMVITDKTIGGIKDIFCEGNGYSCRIKNPASIVNGIKLLRDNDKIILKNYLYGMKYYCSHNFIKNMIDILMRV